MKLLKKAIVNLYEAKRLYNESLLNEYLSDAKFDLACYNIQQSLELFIKFTIDYNNDTFKTTHMINDNIDKCVDYIRDSELKNLLISNAGLYDSVSRWSTESIYKSDFSASKIAFNAICNICEKFENYYKDVPETDDKDVKITLDVMREFKCINCKNYNNCNEDTSKKSECINSNYKYYIE